MKGKLTLIAALLIISLPLSSHPPALALSAPTPLWHRIYGGATDDRGYNLIECSSGGFAFTGYAYDSGDESDVWLVRIDADGHQLWQRSYDSDGYDDQGRSMVEVSTGGFAIIANAFNYTSYDESAWLIRIDANGNHLWNKTYGTSSYPDQGWSLIEVSTGGFAFAGYTYSYGAGFNDFWLVRLDESGNVLWNRTYGTAFAERAYKLIEVSTGGFAMVGNVYNATHSSLSNAWMVRVDASGNHLWNKTFDRSDDWCRALTEVSSGGFALAAYTNATDIQDLWLIRLDANGNHLWNTTYLRVGREYARTVLEYGGGFVINGYTNGSTAGNYDAYLLQTDANGVQLWDMVWGGSLRDRSYSAIGVSTGGLAILGYTRSFCEGDSDHYDTFIVRLPGDAPVFDLLVWLPVIIIIVVIVIVLVLVIWYIRRRK